MRPTFLMLLFALALPQLALAQPRPEYIQFEPPTVKGALYRPESGEADIGILIIHRVNNFLGHGAAWQLARRGFVVLAMNSRFDNNEAAVIWEAIALDVKLGVEFLRKTAGVRKVILFGHSGGAATLSFYQAVAEKGIAFCRTPQKLTACGSELANLPRADGLILADASSGNPVGLLRSLNPAVVSEGDPKALDPALDPFSPANGFNPDGPASYSPEFRQRYYAAQSARMNRLIELALAQVRQLGTERAMFPDDNVFLIVRAFGARLPERHRNRHRPAAKAAQEQRIDRDGADPNRSVARRGESFGERHIRRCAAADAALVSHGQRDPVDLVHGGRGLVLQQQFDAVRAGSDYGSAPRLGDGRRDRHSRQRTSV